VGDDNRRLWARWVATQIGGDETRQRAALEVALQTLQAGHSPEEAATAARASAGVASTTTVAPVQPGVLRCRFCGSAPARAMTVYEHNGYVILMQFKHLKGPFCRSCGLYTWRKMTNDTLLRGWLGVFSFFIAPLTALVNLINRPKLDRLPPPEPGTALRPPADPGANLFHRPGVYVYAAVILAAIVIYVVPAVAGR